LKRKAALQKELQRAKLERIVYTQHVGENGENLFQAADQLGLEGVIGKKANSPYPRGRTPNWVKVKTAHGRHIDEEQRNGTNKSPRTAYSGSDPFAGFLCAAKSMTRASDAAPLGP